ncbi:hypothetical protein ANN_26315 [Periplaneta americana]|uniref:Uncharacterized protein n=1 Tax=Periplaneta americana TaxID=6978 RepID=A0ABQ8S5L5_PERAM|nr:hypothetical protein ANN_26315 [Periplaneta americana]
MEQRVLPLDLATRWHNWTTSLPSLLDITIPRWAGTSNHYPYEIHVFCDSSERVYEAALYIRSSRRMSSKFGLYAAKADSLQLKE